MYGKEISIFILGYEQRLMQPHGEIMIASGSEGYQKMMCVAKISDGGGPVLAAGRASRC